VVVAGDQSLVHRTLLRMASGPSELRMPGA
jgi:hypothetical protein